MDPWRDLLTRLIQAYGVHEGHRRYHALVEQTDPDLIAWRQPRPAEEAGVSASMDWRYRRDHNASGSINREGPPILGGESIDFNPDMDAMHAKCCRYLGGFPRAVTLGARTFWVTADGRIWRALEQ